MATSATPGAASDGVARGLAAIVASAVSDGSTDGVVPHAPSMSATTGRTRAIDPLDMRDHPLAFWALRPQGCYTRANGALLIDR